MAFIPAPHAAARPDRKQIVISSDTTNYNLANDLTNNYGWDGTSPIDAQVTINPGVSVSATATTAPAFHADLVSGSTLTLDNHGVIVGKGGAAGSAGGHAISLQDVAATINNIPARNLLSKSEALGDWSFTGSPTVTANANSKNIIPWSQKIQSWTNGGTTVVEDAMIAPDGTKTMDTIEVNAGSTYQWANRGMWFNVATSTLHTISVYMKHSGSNRTLINYMNPASPYTSLGRLYHDWSNGTPTQHAFSGTGATGTPVLEDVGNDIWRISFQVMSSATATAAGLAIYPHAGQTGNDPIGVWGVQVQEGGLSVYEETGGSSNPPIANPVNGSATVDLLTRTQTAVAHIQQTGIAKPAHQQAYTFSVYAKRSIGDYVTLQLYATWPNRADVVFNLATGKVHSTAQVNFTNTSGQIESVGSGWYKCSITSTTDTHTSLSGYMTVNSNGTTINSADSVTNSAAYFWGAQLELTHKNLYKSPEDLTVNSHWVYAATVTADAAVNPVDGAMTADKIEKNATSASREQTVTLVAGQTYIHSVFVKNINASTSRLHSWNNSAGAWLGYVNIAWGGTGAAVPTLTTHYGASDEIAEDVGNGWWRISYRETTAAGSGPHAHGIVSSLNSVGTGLYAYGFTVELLTPDGKPSPYVPVSRNLLDHPEDTDKWGMASGGVTVVKDALIAPDGSGADTIADFGSLNHSIYENMTLETSTIYTYSGYYRHTATNATRLAIADNVYSVFARVNIDWDGNGVASMGGHTGTINRSVTDAGGGWYRVSFSFTSDTQATHNIYVFPDRNASNTPVGVWGVQLEKGAKNLVEQPERFDSSYWSAIGGATRLNNPNSVNIIRKSESFVTAGVWGNHPHFEKTEDHAIAPDGTHTADLLTKITNAGGWIGQTFGANRTGATNFTWSCFAKKSVGDYFTLRLQTPWPDRMDATFNINTGAVHSTSVTNFTNISASISNEGNGWYRCSVSGTTPSSTGFVYNSSYVSCNSNGGDLSGYDSVSNSAVFVWGAQLQYGSTLSEYEPTGSTANPKILAPNGTETANLLTAGSGSYGGLTLRKYLPTSDIEVSFEHTLSVYVKKINHRYIHLRHPSSLAIGFDFDTLSFIGTSSSAGATNKTVEPVGDGWYRISVSFAQPSGANTNAILDLALADSNGASSSASVSGGEAFYAWGLQFERGPLTPYEEASNYIAITNKSTRYQPFDDGVVTTLGGLGTSSRTPRILAGGGGGGSGGQVTQNNATQDEQGNCENNGHTLGGGGGGTGAGPAAATSGSNGSTWAGGGSGGSGGSGGTYGAAGTSGTTGSGIGCAYVVHGAGGGGAAGKAIHLVSGATLTLRSNGDVLGATS